MALQAGPRKTAIYMTVSLVSMYAGSVFVQLFMQTDMDLSKEVETVRRLRKVQREREVSEKSRVQST
jgi:hypothetical protein